MEDARNVGELGCILVLDHLLSVEYFIIWKYKSLMFAIYLKQVKFLLVCFKHFDNFLIKNDFLFKNDTWLLK